MTTANFDIPLDDDGIVIEVDWNRDGMWDHARSNLSAYWSRGDYQFGTSRRSNPQRPTNAAGAGRLVLAGDDFIAGRSSFFTLTQLQQRYPCRARIDSTVLWEGWIEGPRHQGSAGTGGVLTTFELEGKLERPGRARRMITQGSANVTASATAVLDLLRNAYGLDAADFAANVDATPLSLYSFDGPVAQYASLFGQVSGGLPCARRAGQLRLQDPSNRPNSIQVFSNADYVIEKATSEFQIEQLWNVLSTSYPSTIDGNADAALSRQNTRTASGDLPDSPPISGDNVLLMGWDTSGNQHNYPVNLSIAAPSNNQRIVSGRFRVRPYYWYRWTNTPGDGPQQQELNEQQREAGLYDFYVNGSVQGNGSLTASISDRFATPLASGGTWRPNALPDTSHLVNRVFQVYYRVTAEYKLEIPDSAPVMVGNDASIAAWGPRTLEIEGWIQNTATTALQARIDDLAEPRNIVTVDFALRQTTNQRTADVAGIQPGDHIGVLIDEPGEQLDINAAVMVMNVGYRLARNRLSTKRVVCIEAGAAAVAPAVPSAPSAPTWSSVTQRTATINWAGVSATPSVLHYDVRYRTTNTGGWTQVDDQSGRSLDVTGLTPNTAYEAQVRAVNSEGDGPWSDSGTVTTLAIAAPGAPDAPTFSARTHSSFTAAWTAPTDTGGGTISSYSLRYRTGGGAWTTIATINALTRRVTGLTVGASYEVQVAARNTGGLGDWSESGTVALHDVPAAPDPPSATSPQPAAGSLTRSLAITWTAPLSDRPITSYSLRYRTVGGEWTTIDSITTRSRTVSGLAVSTVYQMQVRAVSEAGTGGWSATGSATTYGAVAPARMGAPTLSVLGRLSLSAAWTAPANGGGAITSYDLRYRTGTGGWTIITGVSTGAEISGLTQSTAYQVQVRAVNAGGPGQWSPSATATTAAPGEPAAPTNLAVAAIAATGGANQRTLRATWAAPTDNGGFAVTHYDLRHKRSNINTWTRVDGVTSAHDINGLQPDAEYDVQVRAANARGDGAWSTSVTRRTADFIVPARMAAPTPTAVDATVGRSTREVSVAWSAPILVGGDPPSRYSVRYRVPSSQFWTTIGNAGSSSPHVVASLAIGQAYQFQVAAINSAGASPWSPSATATTAGPTVPAQMVAPTLAVQGADEILVTWVRPDQGGATVSDYTLRYRVSGAANWTTVASTGGTGLAYNIQGLTRATAYEVQLAAINSVGTGDWSPSATATTDNAAPSVPTAFNLIADESEAGHETRGILVTWAAPADAGGSAITRYDVRYKLSSAAGHTIVDAGLPAADPLSYQLEGLLVATAYDAGVRAVNAAGEGPWVDGSVTTDGPVVPAAPAAPTVRGIEGSDDLLATWTEPDDGGSPITVYTARIRQNGTSGDWTFAAGITTLTNRFSDLMPATEYEIQVRATNAIGNSEWSESGTGTSGDVADVWLREDGGAWLREDGDEWLLESNT